MNLYIEDYDKKYYIFNNIIYLIKNKHNVFFISNHNEP